MVIRGNAHAVGIIIPRVQVITLFVGGRCHAKNPILEITMINLNITSTREKLRDSSRHRRTAPVIKSDHLEPQRGSPTHQEDSRLDFEPMKHAEPPQRAMRVLLRNSRTMMYLRSQDHWTKNPRKARDFRNGWWATLCAFTMDPQNLVIQYDFDDDRYNLDIPVVPAGA